MDVKDMLRSEIFLVILALIVVLLMYYIYTISKRMETVTDLPCNLNGYKFSGIVTHVGDGDGFKVFHVPWFRSSTYDRRSPKLSIRLAGIDAPEVRYFNKPEQLHAKESREFLKQIVLDKMVSINVLGVDMYNRILAIVYVKIHWLQWINANIELVSEGMACVYTGSGALYGQYKNKLLIAEGLAKDKGIGMWKNKNVVLPKDHKYKYR